MPIDGLSVTSQGRYPAVIGTDFGVQELENLAVLAAVVALLVEQAAVLAAVQVDEH